MIITNTMHTGIADLETA